MEVNLLNILSGIKRNYAQGQMARVLHDATLYAAGMSVDEFHQWVGDLKDSFKELYGYDLDDRADPNMITKVLSSFGFPYAVNKKPGGWTGDIDVYDVNRTDGNDSALFLEDFEALPAERAATVLIPFLQINFDGRRVGRGGYIGIISAIEEFGKFLIKDNTELDEMKKDCKVINEFFQRNHLPYEVLMESCNCSFGGSYVSYQLETKDIEEENK